MLDNLVELGYHTMTPIQAKSLPFMLTGQDVMGQASTGTGKTAAFGLAVLARVKPGQRNPQALVLCPTRELAAQVADELRRLGRWLPNLRIVELCGGKPGAHQRDTLARGADIIVGTPGRIMDHMERDTVVLRHVTRLVLDEADRMLDMGFIDDVNLICAATNNKRQTLLFSATMDDRVLRVSANLQRDPMLVSARSEVAPSIDERIYDIGQLTRQEALLRALAHHSPAQALIFCEQRVTCDEVVEHMRDAGFEARALHGGMEQRDRDAVLAQLANGSMRWLVATDVAARGIDIPDLAAVINFQLPREAETYTHRIGRTGRAGAEGVAISLVDASKERRRMDQLGTPAPTPADALPPCMEPPDAAPCVTVTLHAGRRDKLRPGDIVGALTKDIGLAADDIGPIQIHQNVSFVAIRRAVAQRAVAGINDGHIKNRRVRAAIVQ
jgi:ATP-dependent RNA helicase DbpA